MLNALSRPLETGRGHSEARLRRLPGGPAGGIVWEGRGAVTKVRPWLVIPIHWDDFFSPLGDRLEGQGDPSVSFGFLIKRLKEDNIRFGILQGYQSVTLFGTAPKKWQLHRRRVPALPTSTHLDTLQRNRGNFCTHPSERFK